MEIKIAQILISLTAMVLSTTPGVFSRSRASFDLNSLPKFVHTSNNFTYRVGQVAVLDCVISNLGKRKVIWRRASFATPLTVGYLSFNEDPRYSVEHAKDSDKWNLVIRGVKKSDAGIYECQVSSRMKHLRRHVTLLVLDPMPVTDPPARKSKIQIYGSDYVDEGDRIFLKCNGTITDYPPNDIDWFRSGNALDTNPEDGMFIRKKVSLTIGRIESTMEIKHAKLTDQGTYVCRTSNKDVTSIRINVLKGDSVNVKRNTEKKVDIQEQDGGQALVSNFALVLVLSLMTSLVTSFHFPVREVT